MGYQFYQDPEKKVIRADLLDKEAENIASSFFSGNGRRPMMVSSHQLRRFYNEIKNLEKQLDHADWEIVYPMVRMVKSKISYATADSKIRRDEQPLYRNFKDFLTGGIDSISDVKDFKAFCKMFEAVVGFYYGKGGK